MSDKSTITRHGIQAGDYLQIMSAGGEPKRRIVVGTIDYRGNLLNVRDLTRWELFKMFVRHPIREFKFWRKR